MLLRFAYLSVSGLFALLRLLPASDQDKNAEILVLRHQIIVLQRQLGTTKPRFSPADRAFLAALLHRLPRDLLSRPPGFLPLTCHFRLSARCRRRLRHQGPALPRGC